MRCCKAGAGTLDMIDCENIALRFQLCMQRVREVREAEKHGNVCVIDGIALGARFERVFALDEARLK